MRVLYPGRVADSLQPGCADLAVEVDARARHLRRAVDVLRGRQQPHKEDLRMQWHAATHAAP